MARSLSHEVGILSLGRIAAYAVMFFVPLVNVRALSVEEYGYYRQFWLIFETLSPILILGFPRSLLYHLPRADTPQERSAYLTQTVLFLTATSIAGMGIYGAMAETLGQGLGATARAFFWRVCFFTLFMVVTEYMEVLFIAERRPVAQTLYHATASIVQSVAVIVSSFLSRDVSTIVWTLSFFALARFLFAMVYTDSRYRLSLRLVSLHSIREQLAFALPVGLAGVALILMSQTDKFIISRFLGREAFAIYAVGAFQVPFVNIIRTSIGNVTFPLIAQYEKEGNHSAILELSRRALLKTAVLFFPIFVFLELSARPFVTILFTAAYADATPVFRIYLFIFLLSTVEAGAIIQAHKRTMFLFVGFLAGLVVNIALGVGLFSVMGRLGVPLAVVITMYVLSVVNLCYSARLIRASFFALIPLKELGKRMLAAVAPGAALWYLYDLHPVGSIYELAAGGVFYFALYFVLGAATRLVTVEDLKSLFGKRSV